MYEIPTNNYKINPNLMLRKNQKILLIEIHKKHKKLNKSTLQKNKKNK